MCEIWIELINNLVFVSGICVCTYIHDRMERDGENKAKRRARVWSWGDLLGWKVRVGGKEGTGCDFLDCCSLMVEGLNSGGRT